MRTVKSLRKMVESANRKIIELEKVQKSRTIGRYINGKYKKFRFGDIRYADVSVAYSNLQAKSNDLDFITFDEKTNKLRFTATEKDIAKMSESERNRLYYHINTFINSKTSTKRNIDQQFVKMYNTYIENETLKNVSFKTFFNFITNSDYNRLYSMFGSTVVVNLIQNQGFNLDNAHLAMDITANLLTQIFNYLSKNTKLKPGKIPRSAIEKLLEKFTAKSKQINSSFDINNDDDIKELLEEAGFDLDRIRPRMRSNY